MNSTATKNVPHVCFTFPIGGTIAVLTFYRRKQPLLRTILFLSGSGLLAVGLASYWLGENPFGPQYKDETPRTWVRTTVFCGIATAAVFRFGYQQLRPGTQSRSSDDEINESCG